MDSVTVSQDAVCPLGWRDLEPGGLLRIRRNHKL